MWHNLDQPFHARRSAELGVGPLGFPKRKLSSVRLAGLLEALLTSPRAAGYRARAGEVAAVVTRERGTATAVRTLREWRLL